MRRALLSLLALLACAPNAEAWGFAAHRLVNRKAIDTLPAPLAALFQANADWVAEHSIDPDLWAISGRAGEGPNHFLDLDAFGAYPFDAIPMQEAEHLRRHGEKAVERGRVPWRVGEVYRELISAFRAKQSSRILERAAVLAHYAGDVHMPLHAVLNYDGQLTGQGGVHGRLETTLYERFERQIEPDVRPAAAEPVDDPVALTFTVLRESFLASAEVLAADKACAGPKDLADTPQDDHYDDAYYSRFYERQSGLVKRRLTQSAERIGALWLSAWIEAGRPELPEFRFSYVRRGARMVLISLDGSSAPMLDDAVARGVMPNLARLRVRGATARGSLTSLPAKTPSGHAALFTGAWSDRNGIGGIELPVPGASVVNAMSGYLSSALTAEPIWITAARQGLDVSVTSATQAYPFGPYLEERRYGGNYGRGLTLFDGYHTYKVPSAVYTTRDVSFGPAAGWIGALPPHVGAARDFSLTISGARVDGLVYDDPADPASGFDTMYLTPARRGAGGIVLKPTPPEPGTEAFAALALRTRVGEIGLHFRLFALAPDASQFLLYQSEAGLIRSSRPAAEAAALKATGGFIGDGPDALYKEGALGPPIWKGGDGAAEARYLEGVRLTVRQFRRLFDFGFDRTRWDLLLGYIPYPDETFHLWLGFVDPQVPGHDLALAARVRPFVDEALRIVDGYVGHVAERAGPDTIVAVGGDHGQEGTSRVVYFNVALRNAGLLVATPDGSIDLFRTKAVYFPGNSGYFLLNRASRKQGIVRPEEENGILLALKSVLRSLKDPKTGRALVTEIIDPREGPHEPAIGGEQGGDLYVTLPPGYYSSAALRGELVSERLPSGEHLYGPHRPGIQVGFTVAGPGVVAGADLGRIRQVDIAPTLCALLGIDPPAHAVGEILLEALAWPLPAEATGRGHGATGRGPADAPR